jgi:hypothetical protein
MDPMESDKPKIRSARVSILGRGRFSPACCNRYHNACSSLNIIRRLPSGDAKGLKVLTLLAAVCLLSSANFQVIPAYASTVQQCSAQAGSQCTLTFNLSNGDKVSGSISITGGSSNDVNFYVTNPSGAKIYDAGRVTDGTSFAFTADTSGAYILHFDNSFSLLSAKQVTVSYDVSSGGIPEFPPQILLLTVLSLFVVVSYMIIRRRVTNAPS